ncbi:MAG: hypothetical protein R3A47_10555 [Polyangiales bacterium]
MSGSIHKVSDLRSYFEARLSSAESRLDQPISSNLREYLLELLGGSRHQAIVPGADDALGVALISLQLEADRGRRFAEYQRIGDTALYRCGVFPETLKRRGLKSTYMVNIGRAAYTGAAECGRTVEQLLTAVFTELVDRFEAISSMLNEAMLPDFPKTPQDVVRLIGQWHRTRSDAVATLLSEAGVPLPDPEILH